MLQKTIKYTDYNGVERTEDFYFNLSKAEITKMEVSKYGGLSTALQKIIDSQDLPQIMEIFNDFILKSYGEKSPDGKRFVKSEEISNAFQQTEAYSELFMELMSDSKAAADFMNGIIPAGVDKIDNGLAIESISHA